MAELCIKIEPDKMTDESWDALNRAMDELFDRLEEEAEGIAKKFGVSLDCALDIQYLRTRSRWTEDAEAELIRMDKAGEELPNIFDWP